MPRMCKESLTGTQLILKDAPTFKVEMERKDMFN